MKTLGNFITYLPATEPPLSADVYVIEGKKSCYIYDVGASPAALRAIEAIKKEKVVILSHFHHDHTGNLEKVGCGRLYAGDLTAEHIGRGTVVRERLCIADGVFLEIISCPSVHTGGSLIVNVNREYCLIADLYFSRPPADKGLARQMIESLANVDTKYFVASHSGEDNVFEKAGFLREIRKYFAIQEGK